MNILVTGGLGYIGSHTVLELSKEHEITIIDNLYNSHIEVLKKLEFLTKKIISFYNIDITDFEKLKTLFEAKKFDCCIHFAARKSVSKSSEIPLDYYTTNVTGTLNLLKLLKEQNCKKFIFSSSACVYGIPEKNPISEEFETGKCSNPYGRTKYFVEEILKDLYASDNSWDISILRYFNPIGADESGLLNEDPIEPAGNLMPAIIKSAISKTPLKIYGNDYDTPDGTCIRDFIHVKDVALGHIKALECKGLNIFNLGTGVGYSVMDILKAFNTVNNTEVKYKIENRRAGDIDCYYADPSKANKELNWKAHYSLEQMCKIECKS